MKKKKVVHLTTLSVTHLYDKQLEKIVEGRSLPGVTVKINDKIIRTSGVPTEIRRGAPSEYKSRT
jgi:hypothetical protein